MFSCTCLIPFYNEQHRLKNTVKKAISAKVFSHIICIDDGSDDRITQKVVQQIKTEFPQVKIIKLPTNTGKSEAIKIGLQYVTTEWVFLLDADLKNLKTAEITTAVTTLKNHAKQIDMLVLRRAPYNWFITLTRHDILVTGERILKTNALKKVYQQKPFRGYQLEIAINHYFKNRQNFWLQTSWANIYRAQKWGMMRSVTTNIEMLAGFVGYAGTAAYLDQLMNFCRKPISVLEKTN